MHALLRGVKKCDLGGNLCHSFDSAWPHLTPFILISGLLGQHGFLTQTGCLSYV